MAARPGSTTGTITRHSRRSVPQPSMRAASSSSRGTSRMKLAISQMPIGRFSVACASIDGGVRVVEAGAAEHHVPRAHERDRRNRVEQRRGEQERVHRPARPRHALDRIRGKRRDDEHDRGARPPRSPGCCGSSRGSPTCVENSSSSKLASVGVNATSPIISAICVLNAASAIHGEREDARSARAATSPTCNAGLRGAHAEAVIVTARPRRRRRVRETNTQRHRDEHHHGHRRPVAHLSFGEEAPEDREADDLGGGARAAAGQQVDLVEHLDAGDRRGTRA